MTFEKNKAALYKLVEASNIGDLKVLDEILTTEFWDYIPHPDEQNAPPGISPNW